MITVLDGPMGTALEARGIATAGPAWSARAVLDAPEAVAAIHRAYAAAGATVHTANTFRTTERAMGDGWEAAARRAVAIARGAVPAHHRVAGSVAPLEDCYRPDLVPQHPRPEHRRAVANLAATGVDLLLCETFPDPGEARIAVEEAVATGLETWLALTAGPRGELMSPEVLAGAARDGCRLGASRVLVNCVGVAHIDPYVDALARLGVPFGVYANAGAPVDGYGWTEDPSAAERYAAAASRWCAAGATAIGGCCGTGPAHIAALARLADDRQQVR